MRINAFNTVNTHLSFSSKKENDSTYWRIKNPESAQDKLEKHFAMDFIKRFPNWEQNENLVHRLKQDTIKSRAQGKLHSKWHEFDTFPGVSALAFSALTILSLLVLLKNKNLNKSEKILFKTAAVLSPIFAIDNLMYIFTGSNLFDKRKSNK